MKIVITAKSRQDAVDPMDTNKYKITQIKEIEKLNYPADWINAKFKKYEITYICK